jgi:hypothetical protein
MTQYLLSVHGCVDDPQPAEQMTAEQSSDQMAQVMALEDEMKSAGAWLFSGRLTGPDTATVVHAAPAATTMTDGPFVESKEHLAGFYIVEATDLDAALAWATKTSAIIGKPIEVRPFWGES